MAKAQSSPLKAQSYSGKVPQKQTAPERSPEQSRKAESKGGVEGVRVKQ